MKTKTEVKKHAKTELLTGATDVELFIEALKGAAQNLIEAGRIAARNLDIDPDWADKVLAKEPNYTHEFIHRIADVGRGKVHWKLLFSESTGAKMLRKMPFDLQEKYIHSPIPTLVKGANGKTEQIGMDPLNMQTMQARMVFDPIHSRIRSVAEQRAFLEEQELHKAKPITQEAEYEIIGTTLFVRRSRSFEKAELRRIIRNMPSK